MAETMVRMGEYAVSAAAGDVLVSLGLGSCIGLALIDRWAGVAGLAHVVLPGAEGRRGGAAKFADRAVPVLLDAVLAAGAARTRLETVLVGGASMFPFGGTGLDIGPRNELAVREQLAGLRIPVVAAETGGARGRTVRVSVGSGDVTSKAAGEPAIPIHPTTVEAAA